MYVKECRAQCYNKSKYGVCLCTPIELDEDGACANVELCACMDCGAMEFQMPVNQPAYKDELPFCTKMGYFIYRAETSCGEPVEKKAGQGRKAQAAEVLPRQVEMEGLFDERRCRVCGCTDDRACPGGCSWVEEDLCSKCVKTKGA